MRAGRIREDLIGALPIGGSNEARRGESGFASATRDQELLERALEKAIGKITMSFTEARQEYETAGNASDEAKWHGEMIAYANAVGVLEKLKRDSRTGV